jgi:molybdopterin-guanine dinucleotide biosynthesis protein A
MGQDKALVPFRGTTLIGFILDQVAELGTDIGIITNRPDSYLGFGLPLYQDEIEGFGALAGIHTALANSPQSRCLLLACDMPFINIALMQHLIALAPDYDAVVPQINDRFAEPFRAIYHRRCLAAVERSIAEGHRRVISFFDHIDLRIVARDEIERFDPDARSFFNVNTPGELAEAERLAANWPASGPSEPSAK